MRTQHKLKMGRTSGTKVQNAEVLPFHRPFIATQWQGAFWKVLSCFSFALVNIVVRYINGGSGGFEHPLSPYEITFLQYLCGAFFMLPTFAKSGFASLKTKEPVLHIVRAVAAVMGVILWYFSLFYMDIAKALALNFTGPMFAVIGAKFYLQERVGLLRWGGILTGFIGTFIITRPDKVLFPDLTLTNSTIEYGWISFLPLGSAVMIAISKLTGRQLGIRGESPRVLTTYLLFLMVPASFIPAVMHWSTPTLEHILWMLVLGLLSAAANYSLAKALSLAEITFLNPFGFSKLVLSTGLSYIVFNEFPKSLSVWAGTAVIITGIVLMSLDNSYRFRKMSFD